MLQDGLLVGGEMGRLDSPSPQDAAQLGSLERLPKWLNLIPMVVQWIWLGVKHLSFTLPAAINPAITAGGLIGEGKSEYFRIMGAHARSLTADFAIFSNAGMNAVREAEIAMRDAGLEYPLIAKPDIGWCGFGVRLIRDRGELVDYFGRYPLGEKIVLQRFITYEGEAGLYYVRDPEAAHGRLMGILLRSFPRVVGDGRRTVAELISAHPRASRLGHDGYSESCCDLGYIPAAHEIVRVSITGSTRVGGQYSDATSLITPALEAAIDAVARDMTQLHAARFDIRYESLAELRNGKLFSIIEVNGAGSEAVHAWDPRYSLRQAYRIVFQKQRLLFALGAKMRRRGHKAPGLLALAKLYRHQADLIRRYPPSN
jgi:hypothetical protein